MRKRWRVAPWRSPPASVSTLTIRLLSKNWNTEPYDLLQSARNRLRARPLHRRPARSQTRRRDRAQKPLAAPAAQRRTARKGAAEKHLDDRPDRLRQDR